MRKIALKNLAAALDGLEDPVVGFFDETAPQTTANTVRVWSFGKSRIVKNTSPYRANTFGFYTLNGTSVLSFQERSRKENVIDVLEAIREENPDQDILLVLDNFPSHTAKKTQARADELGITLVFLPPYSPHLNPIELVWKSLKRHVSTVFAESEEHFKSLIKTEFYELSAQSSFASKWHGTFLTK